MENFIVFSIVGIAAVYLGRVCYLKYLQTKSSAPDTCECGCASCNVAENTANHCGKIEP